MNQPIKNIAYIDGANLHNGIESLGWWLDYRRFRVWLKEKFGVERAYIFLGLIPKFKDLYTYLQQAGFTLVFKEVVYDGAGKAKGNCDADLVLQAARDVFEGVGGQAVIVTSDGYYASLVKFLLEKQKLVMVLSPAHPSKCSILIKRTKAKILYLNDKRSVLAG